MVEAWRLLRPLWLEGRDLFMSQMRDLGLTPPHGHALMTLGAGPARMRDLADNMACDASYVTAVVDKLEELGYAERRSAPEDRRVREVVLTKRGRQVAQRLDRALGTPPAALEVLSASDGASLIRILRKLDLPQRATLHNPATRRTA